MNVISCERSIRSPACGSSLTWLSPPGLPAREELSRAPRPRDDVRIRVPLRQEPVLTRAAEPPFALDAPLVPAEVDVLVQLAHRRGLRGARRRLARTAQLVDLAGAAVGAGDEKRHGEVRFSAMVISLCATPSRRTQRLGAYRRERPSSTLDSGASAPPSAPLPSSTRSPTAASLARTRSRGARASRRAPSRASSARSPRRGSSSTTPTRAAIGSACRIVRLANAVLARLDVRQVARPHLEELVRITGETATLARSRRGGRGHGRLRPERALRPARDPARPPVDRLRDLGRQGHARVLRAAASVGPVPGLHPAHAHDAR